MSNGDAYSVSVITERLRSQAASDAMRVTVHAHQEMVDENITLEEVRDVLLDARIVEDYPDHRRGPCCLACGRTGRGRYVHVVCTTSLEVAIIITVYEPHPPKWVDPFERRRSE
jgi:hypothetical protein